MLFSVSEILASPSFKNKLLISAFEVHSIIVIIVTLGAVVSEACVFLFKREKRVVKFIIVSTLTVAFTFVIDKYLEDLLTFCIKESLEIIYPKNGQGIEDDRINVEVSCTKIDVPVYCVVKTPEGTDYIQGESKPKSHKLVSTLNFTANIGSGNIGLNKDFKIFAKADYRDNNSQNVLMSNMVTVRRIKKEIDIANLISSNTGYAESPCSITIDVPKSEENVKLKTLVKGKVSNKSLKVFVAIHPMATNKFFIQPIPTISSDGSWQAFCYFGESKKGIGEPFEIIALSSKDINLLKEGDTLPSPLPDMENILCSSEAVIVIRNE